MTLSLRIQAAAAALWLCAAIAHADPAPDQERFDGSFLLEDGRIVTGGYMVEGGDGFFVYLDAAAPATGGQFERGGDLDMRSVFPDETVTARFSETGAGEIDSLIWNAQGEPPLAGKRVFPHRSREVSFSSGDGTVLSGRLMEPVCPGPHPAVVLVHGSGPVDRHAGPFATVFLQRGVAVLSYDKRGYTEDADAWREPDLARMSEDATAAVRFAVEEQTLDSSRIGIFGSSQGGWTAPPAAAAADEAAYLILRVGAALSQKDTVMHEVRQELRADGLSGLDLDKAMALRGEIHDLAIAGEPLAAADSLARPYLAEDWYREAFGDGPPSDVWAADWWDWAGRNLSATPVEALAGFGGPVLWFLAEDDENVPLVPTRAALERAFAASPGDDHTISVIPDAPHSFFAPSPDGPRYTDRFFEPMLGWMAARGFTDPGCWPDGN